MNATRVWYSLTKLSTCLASGIFFLPLMLLISIALFTSCDKDCPDPNPVNDPVYFQFESNNYAWGFQQTGWYVDQSGNFKYYKLPAGWVEPDSLGYISKQDLIANLAKADSVIYQVSVAELQHQIGLIEDVDESAFSAIQHVAADIGKLDLYCFRWDKSISKYKRLSLATSGDIEQHNLDPQAQELTAWLVAEGKKGGFFYW